MNRQDDPCVTGWCGTNGLAHQLVGVLKFLGCTEKPPISELTCQPGRGNIEGDGSYGDGHGQNGAVRSPQEWKVYRRE